MSVRVFAPAKINLTLEVAPPRADGMHPLQSAVVFADVGDWIEAAPAEDLSLKVSGPFAADAPSGADNLVLRAAALLSEGKRGATLKLEKNLPVASGMGGGSSDAAAALKALNELWRLQLGADELAQKGALLGADVAVCVRGGSAWMSGVGEITAPLRVLSLHAVLVNPGSALSTAAVFRKFDEMGLGAALKSSAAAGWDTSETVARAAAQIGNSLAAPARALMPEIAEIEDTLRADARTLYAALSGSGATCFALVRTAGDAAALAQQVAESNPHWWVQPAILGSG